MDEYSDSECFRMILDWTTSETLRGMGDAIWAKITGLDEMVGEVKK